MFVILGNPNMKSSMLCIVSIVRHKVTPVPVIKTSLYGSDNVMQYTDL